MLCIRGLHEPDFLDLVSLYTGHHDPLPFHKNHARPYSFFCSVYFEYRLYFNPNSTLVHDSFRF